MAPSNPGFAWDDGDRCACSGMMLMSRPQSGILGTAILVVWFVIAAGVGSGPGVEPPGRTSEGFWSLLVLAAGAAHAGWVRTPSWIVTVYAALGGAVNAFFTLEGRRQYLNPLSAQESPFWHDLGWVVVWVGLVVFSVACCQFAAGTAASLRSPQQFPPAYRWQISLTSLLLLFGALPIWLFLFVLVPSSPGFGGGPTRWFVAPVVLCGVTCALYRLFRNWRDAWAISALVAAIVCLGVLSVVAWIENHL